MKVDLRDALKKIDYTTTTLFLIGCKAKSVKDALDKGILEGIKNLTESQYKDKLKGLRENAFYLWSTSMALIVYLKSAKEEIERKCQGD